MLQYGRIFFMVTIFITIICTVSFRYTNGQIDNDQDFSLASTGTANIIFLTAALISAIAIFVSVYTYRKTASVQSYSDLDSGYTEILCLGIEYPKFRDPKITNNYETVLTGNEKIQYESYAYIVWNFCETISDRTENDLHQKKTWYPTIVAEKGLHKQWFDNNRDKFKDKFNNFIDTFSTKLAELEKESKKQ